MNWLNYKKIIFTVALICMVVPLTKGLKMQMRNDIPTLRMGNNFDKSSSELDPANINTLEEYELSDYLFGRLVQYNNQKLVSDLADSFYWDAGDLVFIFDSNHKTSNGSVITAEDAYYSLKRAIYLKKTGHGDLRNFLCPDHHLNSIHDECPGLRLQGNKLILTPLKSSYGSFLLPFLESADFSIIPKRLIDLDSKNLTIISHKETTGPYFVESDNSSGAWILKANKFSAKYSPDMPQTVELVPANYSDVYEKLIKGEIDLIPTYMTATWNDQARSLYNQRDKFNLFKSMPIRVLLICFTPKAISESSIEQRMLAGKAVASILKETLFTPESYPTVEFFQGLSDGNISDEQREILIKQRNVKKAQTFKKPLQLSISASGYEFYKEKLKDNPEVEVINSKVGAYLLPLEERLDMYIIATDSAWNENISLLGHNFSGAFHLPNLDSNKWLHEYIHTGDKQERMEKLRVLHYEMLKQGVIYPVTVSPYLAFSNKTWSMNFAPFTAGSPLWQMRLQQ